MILTGGTGAIGTEVALQLIEAGVRKLVIWVRDRSNIDQRLQMILQDELYQNAV